MKIETKKIDAHLRELYIEVEPEILKKKFEEVSKRIAKEAKVPGFRPGYIPPDILEKHYGQKINQEVMQELIPHIYNQAIDKENLEVIDYPDIYDVKLTKDSLSFKAKVEVLPQINLKNYRGIKIHYKKIEISEDEVNRYIDALAQKRKMDKIDDGFARSFGYSDIAEMKDSVAKQLFLQKENDQHKRMEKEILDYLLKETDFKTPSSLVERKLQDLLRQAKLELALRGVSKQELETKEKELSQELKGEAEKQARLQIILTQIAKQENIPQDDYVFQRVLEFLFREANWSEVVLYK